MIKAVVFDLDDTLISEKKYIISGFKHISKVLSPRIDVDENIIFKDLIDIFENNTNKVFNRLYEKHNIKYSKQMVLELVREYRNHYPDIQLYDDVLPCLTKLRKMKVKTGIITDGYAISQRNKLEVINAAEYFDEIIVTDELGREFWKPHPKAYEVMKRKLDVQYKEMIYIGDNPEKDFYINKIHPIKTVRIFRPSGVYSEAKVLKNIEPTFEIYKLDSLNEILISIHQNK